MVNVIIGIVILLLFVLAIRHAMKKGHGGCCGNCDCGCGKGSDCCSKGKDVAEK